jgi:anaerobic selenocysteine-containing dehydrogenase
VTAGEVRASAAPKTAQGSLLVIPTVQLYDRERVFQPSVAEVMSARTSIPYAEINAADAQNLKIADGDMVQVTVGGNSVQVKAHVNGGAPAGTVILPRHLTAEAIPLAPAPGEVRKV